MTWWMWLLVGFAFGVYAATEFVLGILRGNGND